ncbi:MAG: alpha-galactosidase [Christensenellaceae bacterium]|jgi:alpha-galactosidase|nr:alpha-galactosidase [Christensenellaceae bacterium]
MKLEDCKFTLVYDVEGITYSTNLLKTEHVDVEFYCGDKINLTIIPKTKTTLKTLSLKFKKDFKEDDRFFANGYQSWTTSKEYSQNDKEEGLTKLVKILRPFKPLAAISGDYLFRERSKIRGIITSYTYAYIRSDQKLELIASLSEKEAFTQITADLRGGFLTIAKDVEGLIVENPTKLVNVAIFEGEYDDVFDKYFKAAGFSTPRIDKLTGYTSWYNYFQKIDETIILRDLDGLDKVKDKVSIFQIDDGYETFVGDWLDFSPKFPKGMKYIAERIHDKGYLAGIWLAPFNVQRKSKTALTHPEWLIKDKKGKPILGCAGWGGAYTLDILNEHVRAHIKKFFEVILNDWEYDMVKLDFLYSQCMYPRNGKSRGSIMSYAMEFLRDCVGEKLMLGCGVPLGSAFGYVDACRISCDADLSFKGRYYNKLHINCEIPSTKNAITNTIFRRHLNKKVFVNDPDVFFLRENNLKFTHNQKLLLAKINNLFGNVLFISDNAGDYTNEAIEILRKAFTKEKIDIKKAEFIDKKRIKIIYANEGFKKTKELLFNIKNGKTMSELF